MGSEGRLRLICCLERKEKEKLRIFIGFGLRGLNNKLSRTEMVTWGQMGEEQFNGVNKEVGVGLMSLRCLYMCPEEAKTPGARPH